MCWCSMSGNHSKPHPGAKVILRGLRVWRYHQDIVPKLCMQQIIEMSHPSWQKKQKSRMMHGALMGLVDLTLCTT